MSLESILNRKEPIIYLMSTEESRAEEELQRYCETQKPAQRLYRWSSTRGLEKVQGAVLETIRVPEDEDPRIQAQAPLVPVLKYAVHTCEDNSVFLLKDVHHYLRVGTGSFNAATALTTRALRDAFYELRALRKALKVVLLCPEVEVPSDLEKELRICDFPLPTKAELALAVKKALVRAQAIAKRDPQFAYDIRSEDGFANALVDAAVGLTGVEVEYILENMLYVERRLGADAPSRMTREKQQIIRKSGVLEYIPSEDLQGLQVGGLEVMLRWLNLRKYVFLNRERALAESGIKQVPRGVLLLGIPGCGKSLVCKKIAQEWELPLLRLDMGAIFDRFVGASEERIRKALRVAESVAPCILWLDELEKGFSTGIGGDGGTSSRVLGTFLIWMQEKKAPVFIAATANDITRLPPELLRAGRFDNRFFVGCPGEDARSEIFEIHLRAHRLDPRKFDLTRLAKLSFGYTGAEIEQSVLDAAYDAFYERRQPSDNDIMRNLQRSRPLVKSLAPQMGRILEMLDEGRIELASHDTVDVKELIDRLAVHIG